MHASASVPAFRASSATRRHAASAPALGLRTPEIDLKASASMASLSRVNPYMADAAPPAFKKPAQPRLYVRKQRRAVVGASNRPHVHDTLEELYSWRSTQAPAYPPMGKTKKTVVEKRPPPAVRPQSAQCAARFAGAPQPAGVPWSTVQHNPFGARHPLGASAPLSEPPKRRPASAPAKASRPGAAQTPEQARAAVVHRVMGHLREHMASRYATSALPHRPADGAQTSRRQRRAAHTLHPRCGRRVLLPVFRSIDEDKSGFLDYDEFEAALRKVGIHEPREHLDWVAATVDVDGDGQISYDEFVKAVCEPEVRRPTHQPGLGGESARQDGGSVAAARHTPRAHPRGHAPSSRACVCPAPMRPMPTPHGPLRGRPPRHHLTTGASAAGSSGGVAREVPAEPPARPHEPRQPCAPGRARRGRRRGGGGGGGAREEGEGGGGV